MDRMGGDHRQYVTQINHEAQTSELSRPNRARGPFTILVGAGKQIVLASQSHAPQGALGGIVVDLNRLSSQ